MIPNLMLKHLVLSADGISDEMIVESNGKWYIFIHSLFIMFVKIMKKLSESPLRDCLFQRQDLRGKGGLSDEIF